MGKMLGMHVQQVLKKMDEMDNVALIEIDYNEMLTNASDNIPRIEEFLGGGLNTQAMAAIIDESLYRQRK